MNRLNPDTIFERTIKALSEISEHEHAIAPTGEGPLPSPEALREIMDCVRTAIFPDFFDSRSTCRSIRPSVISVNIEKIHTLLSTEIIHGFRFDRHASCEFVNSRAENLALKFIDCLPEIKRLLYTDVQAIYNNDPAADDYGEIILSYPVVTAMLHYRVAHALLQLSIPVIPRILAELAHSATGIDINPGARIGSYFAIDHGTGVVIGQTCIIGDHVTIYQGVTLGARNFSTDAGGHPLNTPRHPIIEDGVTIYSNASVLGRITVGRDSVIGGNVWLTESVPPKSRILQGRSPEKPSKK